MWLGGLVMHVKIKLSSGQTQVTMEFEEGESAALFICNKLHINYLANQNLHEIKRKGKLQAAEAMKRT